MSKILLDIFIDTLKLSGNYNSRFNNFELNHKIYRNLQLLSKSEKNIIVESYKLHYPEQNNKVQHTWTSMIQKYFDMEFSD